MNIAPGARSHPAATDYPDVAYPAKPTDYDDYMPALRGQDA
jgi:hypothetical protein